MNALPLASADAMTTSNGTNQTGSPHPQQSELLMARFYFKLVRRHGNERLCRKVIQILEVESPRSLELTRSYLELAKILGKDPDCTQERDEYFRRCQRFMDSLPVQAYLKDPTAVDASFDPLEVGQFCCNLSEGYFQVWNLDDGQSCLTLAIHLFNKAALHDKDSRKIRRKRYEGLQSCRRAMDSLPVKAYLADSTLVDDSFDPLKAALLYRNLGGVHFKVGNLDDARCCMESAVGLFKRCDGARDEQSRCHCSLAQILLQQDDFDKSVDQFKLAFSTSRRITSDLVAFFYELASADFDRDEWYREKIERCCRFISSWIPYRTRDLNGKPMELGRFQCMWGIAHCKLNNLEDACVQAEKAIQIFEEHASESKDSWLSHHVMGRVLFQRKAFAGALEQFQQAAEIAESIDSMSALATTYRDMGSVFRDQADYDQAASFTQRAIKIQENYNALPRKVAQSYRQLGLVRQDEGLECHKRGDYDQARYFIQKAIEIQETRCISDFLDLAQPYKLLGLIFDSQGEHARAFMAYQKAIEFFERSGDVEFDMYKSLGLMAAFVSSRDCTV